MPKSSATLIAEIAGRVEEISRAALQDRALPIESMSYWLGLENSILPVLSDCADRSVRSNTGQSIIPFCQQLLAQIPISSTDPEKTVAAQNFVQQVYNLMVESAVIMGNRGVVDALLQYPVPPEVKAGGFIAAIVAAADWEKPELGSHLIKMCDSVYAKKEALKQVAQLDIGILENRDAEHRMGVCRSILKDLINSFNYEQELIPGEINVLRAYAKPHALDYLKLNVLKPPEVDPALLAARAGMLAFSDVSTDLYTSIQTRSTDPQSVHSNVRGAFFAEPDSSSEDEVDAFNPDPQSPRSSSSHRKS